MGEEVGLGAVGGRLLTSEAAERAYGERWRSISCNNDLQTRTRGALSVYGGRMTVSPAKAGAAMFLARSYKTTWYRCSMDLKVK